VARQATAAEQVFAYVPGGVYKVTVGLDAPLDLILAAGEQVRNLIGSDPQPLPSAAPASQGEEIELDSTPRPPPAPPLKERWEVKEAVHGSGELATPHILIRALVPGATLGLTVTTSLRVYYLTCVSRERARVRAVWWTYPPEGVAPPEPGTPLLPPMDVPRLYHAGYQITTSAPPPTWTPRGAWDDGHKFFIVYPELVLFGTVPLVRLLGPNGPQVVNSFQVLNVVMLDLADVARVELRVGTGPGAEVVTITRGALRTIHCPEDAACPVFPAAAAALHGRQ
jgi:type IV secretion system protein VirB9